MDRCQSMDHPLSVDRSYKERTENYNYIPPIATFNTSVEKIVQRSLHGAMEKLLPVRDTKNFEKHGSKPLINSTI